MRRSHLHDSNKTGVMCMMPKETNVPWLCKTTAIGLDHSGSLLLMVLSTSTTTYCGQLV